MRSRFLPTMPSRAWLCIALCLLLAPIPARAYTLDGVEMLDEGVFIPTSQATQTHEITGGTYFSFAGFSLVYDGSRALINPDHWFGFSFRFIGEPDNALVPFILTIIFPDGSRYQSPGEGGIGQKIWRVVRMNPDLIEPGSYVLELSTKDRTLLRRTFTLVK